MYIIDPKQQSLLIAEMNQLRKDNQTWEVYYHQPSTNDMWKSFFPIATGTTRGPKLLRTEPVADQFKQRLDNCLIEDNQEDALGLGIELSAVPQKWDQILAVSSQHYREYHRHQFSIFLRTLGVEEYRDHFRRIEFNPEEHNLSEKHFETLARRSRKLRFQRFWFF